MQLSEYLASSRGAGSALARHVGVKAPSVWQWAAGARAVPPDRCPALERAASGRVTCEEMRPDIPWSRIPDPDWPHPAGRPVIDPAAPPATAAEPQRPVPATNTAPTGPGTLPPPEPAVWPLTTDRRTGPRAADPTHPAPAPRPPIDFDGDDRGMRDAA